MKIIVLEPGKRPYSKEVANDLYDLQEIVGGNLETAKCFPDGACLMCNEEGKILGLPFNRFLRYDNNKGKIYDCIVGTCFVVGTSGEEFTGLTEEQAAKYASMYYWDGK